MSTTTEAIELVKLLKPKIGEQAAAKLIDYADKQKGDYAARADIAMLKWVVGILAVATVALFGALWQLKTEVHDGFDKIDKRFDRMEKLILQKR